MPVHKYLTEGRPYGYMHIPNCFAESGPKNLTTHIHSDDLLNTYLTQEILKNSYVLFYETLQVIRAMHL